MTRHHFTAYKRPDHQDSDKGKGILFDTRTRKVHRFRDRHDILNILGFRGQNGLCELIELRDAEGKVVNPSTYTRQIDRKELDSKLLLTCGLKIETLQACYDKQSRREARRPIRVTPDVIVCAHARKG